MATGETTGEGGGKAAPSREFQFPRDHGNHPEFAFERWDVRGHLFANHRRFGTRFVMERITSSPEALTSSDPEGRFSTGTLYRAAIAVVDQEGKTGVRQQRVQRSGWDVLSSTDDLDLRIGDWRLQRTGGTIRLQASIRSEAVIELRFVPHKPLVALGRDGHLRDESGLFPSGHHLTYSRMDAEGTLLWGTETLALRGKAALDHEMLESDPEVHAPHRGRLHLLFLDGHEMLVETARGAGDTENTSTNRAFLIDPRGQLSEQELRFSWEFSGRWESPHQGAYPIASHLTVTRPGDSGEKRYLIQPLRDEQWLFSSGEERPVWSGACDVLEEESGELAGWAFVDVTEFPVDTTSSREGL